MASPLAWTPLRQETRQTVRARLVADMNAGRDPGSPTFYDDTPGSVISDLLDTDSIEFERLWDMASVDVPAASMIEYAWGVYLDGHAAATPIERGQPVRATGEVTFKGEEGTIIGVGAEVATIQVDAEDEPVVFRTTEGGTIPEAGEITLPVQAVEAGSAGNVVSDTVVDDLTGVDGITSVSNADPITSGEDEENDEEFREKLKLQYLASRGGGTVDDLKAWALEYPGVGYATVTALFAGEGTARVVITDVNNDPVSDAVEAGVQADIDPIAASTTLDGNQSLPASEGELEVQSTDGFRETGRLLLGDQIVTYTGKTATKFTGCEGGEGEFSDGDEIVQGGLGEGKGPPGLLVAVDTPTGLKVNVAADVDLDDGYSLDGEAGSIDVSPAIEAAVASYLNDLPPGGDNPPGPDSPAGAGEILRIRIAQAILEVEGVYNVNFGTLKLNGEEEDLEVGPLQVPEAGTVTLS